MIKEDELIEVLTKLQYVNGVIKQIKTNSNIFYNCKKCLLEYLILNKESLNVNIIVNSIELANYEQLLVGLEFTIKGIKFNFHQKYKPNLYKNNFDLSEVPFIKYEPSTTIFIFDSEKFKKYLKDIKTFYYSLLPEVAYISEAKLMFPNYTFKLIGHKVKIHYIDGINKHHIIMCKKETLKKSYERQELKEKIKSLCES